MFVHREREKTLFSCGRDITSDTKNVLFFFGRRFVVGLNHRHLFSGKARLKKKNNKTLHYTDSKYRHLQLLLLLLQENEESSKCCLYMLTGGHYVIK